MTDNVEQSPRKPRAGATVLSAGTVFSRQQRWMLLVAFALLVVLRIPRAWVHGRFIDEEATVFLAYAWHHPWLDALFRPFAGYWNFGANATTLFVVELVRHGILPLERAPYLTMIVALAVQMLPAILILTGRASWLTNRLAVVAALLVLAIAPGTEEVFFNVLHIQFHLALCVALILALDSPQRPLERVGYGVLLFLAPLCGPGAIAFLPLFALRGLVDRDRMRLEQLAAFSVGAAIQMTLFYGSSPTRGHLVDPGTLAVTMFIRLIAMPAVSFGKANWIGNAVYNSQVAGGTGWWWIAAISIALFGTLIVVAAKRKDSAIWLVLSGLGIAAVSLGYGMVIVDAHDYFSAGAGERYNFLPLILLGWALIVLAMRPNFPGKRIYAFLCFMMLFTGVTRYTRPVEELRDGPSWPAEVAAWRQDHRHLLVVWPDPFAADLSDEARSCSPIGRNPELSTDPRYCESGWVGSFYRSKANHRRTM